MYNVRLSVYRVLLRVVHTLLFIIRSNFVCEFVSLICITGLNLSVSFTYSYVIVMCDLPLFIARSYSLIMYAIHLVVVPVVLNMCNIFSSFICSSSGLSVYMISGLYILFIFVLSFICSISLHRVPLSL